MLNVALTGNVASGKSTLAKWFAGWGGTIIDSDEIVAELQQPGSPMLSELASEFGQEIILPDGSLDRAALRSRAFANGSATERINAIVHPKVKIRREELIAEAERRGDRVVISDIPLLFEVLDPASFDLVVLVVSHESRQRERLLNRGLSSEEAERMMASQIPAECKRARADIVIENNGSLHLKPA